MYNELLDEAHSQKRIEEKITDAQNKIVELKE